MKRIWSTMFALTAMAALVAVAAAGPGAQESSTSAQDRGRSVERGASAASQQRPGARQRRPGFGKRDDTIRKDYDGPSIVENQPAGVKMGEYPADFQLEPVELYPQLTEWLGSKAPARFEDKVMLSDLVGAKPVMLFFGSYT